MAALAAVIVIGGAAAFMFGGGSVKFWSDESAENTADAAEASSETTTTGGESKSSASPTSTPSTSAAPPAGTSGDVEPATLPSLLASVPDLNDRLKASLTPADAVQSTPFSGLTVQPSNCAGALLPGIDYVYKFAKYSGFAGQILTDDASGTKVVQSVIAFNTQTEATRFYNDQFTAWKGCNYTEITASGGGQQQTMKTGVAAESDGTAMLLMWKDIQDSGNGCQRGMSPRKNVVVDVRVCSPNIGSAGYTLARDIGAKITGQR
ncbi:hypothetical protein BVU76_29795 [Mycolicibacterium porcinum]|nr:hypothetical protein BVU76_29795 [Mycolicibacterium porcinum]